MKRKWIALILAVALLITMVPLFKGLTFAMQAEETHTLCISGQKVWENYEGVAKPEAISIAVFDANGQVSTDTKTISGQGDTWSFSNVCFTVPTLDVNTEYHIQEIGAVPNSSSVGEAFHVTEALHCNYKKSASQPQANSSYTLSNDSNLIVIFKHAGGHYIWKATAWTTDEKAAFDGSAYNNPTFISGTQSTTSFSFDGDSYRFSVSQSGSGYKIDFEKKTWCWWFIIPYWGWDSANHAIEKGSISCNTNYSASNVKLTNTYTPPTTKICGVKTWDDEEDRDGLRPKFITINLMRAGQANAVKSLEVLADEYGVWSWSFEDLPKYDNGEEIEYSIAEDTVSGYEPTINGYNVTNYHPPEKTSITVKKVWEGGVPGTSYPPVTVILNKRVGNDTVPEIVEEITLNDDSWTHTFQNLFVNEGGEKITYSISEVAVPGYKSEIDGNPEEGFTITNTYTPPPTTVPTNTQPETTTTEETTEVPATEPTTSEIVAGDEDEKTTTTITQPTEVVAGDEDEVDVVPTGENYLYLVVAILFILGGVIVLVPAIKKVRVKK